MTKRASAALSHVKACARRCVRTLAVVVAIYEAVALRDVQPCRVDPIVC